MHNYEERGKYRSMVFPLFFHFFDQAIVPLLPSGRSPSMVKKNCRSAFIMALTRPMP